MATVATLTLQIYLLCYSSRHNSHRYDAGLCVSQLSGAIAPSLSHTLSMQILSNISVRLSDMHDAGYVHRDLKPANVMWLPRQNCWTVIDFGCVARIGAQAPLNFTLTYAAPEVIHEFLAGKQSIQASPALDAWALGVMAFELLTGAPAFNILTAGANSVRAKSFRTDFIKVAASLDLQRAPSLPQRTCILTKSTSGFPCDLCISKAVTVW